MGGSNATGVSDGYGVTIGIILALALGLFLYWAVLGVGLLVTVVAGTWYLCTEKGPDTLIARLRAWLAPRYHYPFVGLGSVIASVVGVFAVGEILQGKDPLLGGLILAGVLVRALSMAWFPWPRSQPRGLKAYPWVIATGPISSALGILSVWELSGGGQVLPPSQAGQMAVALTATLASLGLALLATAVGRAGREATSRKAVRRISTVELLSPDAVELGKAMALARWPIQDA